MKKNAPNARTNSGSRGKGSRAPQVSTTRAYRSTSSNSRTSVKSTSRSKKKGNVGKTIGIIAAVAIAVAGIVAGAYYVKNGNLFDKEEKFNVVMADGTQVVKKASEIREELKSDVFYNGIKIDGIDVSGKTREEALALVNEGLSNAPSEVDISLNYDGTTYPLDFSDFPLESNAVEIVNEAFSYARPAEDATGEQLVDCYTKYQDLQKTPKEYMTAFTVKTDGLSDMIHGILDPFNKDVVEAQIESFDAVTCSFSVSDSSEGCSVDIDKAITDTKELLDSRTYTGTVDVDFEILEPENSKDDLTAGLGLIAEADSKTTSDNSRNHNIKITCEKIDGLLLNPGESFSFNGFIGQRTPDKGYELAGVIQGGKSEKDYGGGICQVSSMMYQCASKCDLQIDERHPHQWPSTYCAEGTDATVDWGSADFKFTNDSEYPIGVHAWYDVENTRIYVEFYGHPFDDGSYIKLESTCETTGSATTTYQANATMAVGTTHEVMPAHNPKTAVSYKVWYDKDDNEIKREKYMESYYPRINRIVEVGILNPDGSLATLDPSTGTVSGAVDATSETESSATDSVIPSDSAVPTDTQPVPTDTQPAPTDTQPAPTDTQPVTPPEGGDATEAT